MICWPTVEIICWGLLLRSWIVELSVDFICWDHLLRFSAQLLSLSAYISFWDYLLRSTVAILRWDLHKWWFVRETDQKTMHIASKTHKTKQKTYSNSWWPSCKTNLNTYAHSIKNTKTVHIWQIMVACLRNQSKKPMHAASKIQKQNDKPTNISTNDGLPAKTIKKQCTQHQKHKRTQKTHTYSN